MDNNIDANIFVEAAQGIWAVLSMSWGWFTTSAWPHIWDFLIVGVLYKAIITRWLANILMSWGKRHLLKSNDQRALWFHYRDKAMNSGHQVHPDACTDGLCGQINASK